MRCLPGVRNFGERRSPVIRGRDEIRPKKRYGKNEKRIWRKKGHDTGGSSKNGEKGYQNSKGAIKPVRTNYKKKKKDRHPTQKS